MLFIGITGGIASGKSTVSSLFQKRGWLVVSADDLAHQVLKDKKESIVKLFGPGILSSDGEINRSLLGTKIFSDKELKASLEAVVHPSIHRKLQEKKDLLKSRGHKTAVFEVPLLFESGLENDFDHIIMVYVSEAIQLKRLMERDGLDREEATGRIKSQMGIERKRKRAEKLENMTLIDNRGEKGELDEKIKNFLCDIKPLL